MTIPTALLTIPEADLEQYVAHAWIDAIIADKILACGHEPNWLFEDQAGNKICLFCRLKRTLGDKSIMVNLSDV